MSNLLNSLGSLLKTSAGGAGSARTGKAAGRQGRDAYGRQYDREAMKPVLKCSICNGEQVAGFKDIRTGKFEEVTLIRNEKDLKDFMNSYGIDEISKEY